LLMTRSSRHIPLRSLAIAAARITADMNGFRVRGGRVDGRA
jgi:hypothetical protein